MNLTDYQLTIEVGARRADDGGYDVCEVTVSDGAGASPSAGVSPLEHRESTEAGGLEARGERAEGWRCSTCAAVNRDKLTRCFDCGDERPDPFSNTGHPAVAVPREPDAPVPREHELLAIDGIPAATYPFLPTRHVVFPPGRTLPLRCRVVTSPAIEQPSVDDNKDRCE